MNTDSDVGEVSWVFTLDGLGTSKTCSEIGSELNSIWARLQDEGREAAAAQVDYERQACLLTVSATIVLSDKSNDVDGKARFSGMVGFSDGSQWPDPNGFSEEAFRYLLRRGEETPNPVLKARYLDLVSEKRSPTDKQRLALSAIDAYLDSANGFSSSHVSHKFEMFAAMDQAAFLALRFGNTDKISRVVSSLVALIEQQIASQEPEETVPARRAPRGRWTLELARILLHVRKSPRYGECVSDAQLERVKLVAEEIVRLNADDRFTRSEFLEVASLAAHFLKQGSEEYSLELQRGEALVQQGEVSEQQAGNGPRHLIAATFYENAAQHYLGMRERLNLTTDQREELARRVTDLKLTIRRMYRLGRSELSKFVVLDEFSSQEQAELEAFVDYLSAPATLPECLQRIVKERALLPNVKSAETAALELQGQAPLLSLLPKRLIRDDLTVAVTNDETQILTQQIRDNLLLWIQMNSTVVLIAIFQRLQEHKGFDAATLTEYFTATGLFQEKSLPLIENGLERYFAGDYISALHILVPQYEDVLRSLFERNGQGTIRPRQKYSGWEQETFGAFLERKEIKTFFLPELLSYIQLVMTEPTGWNLRNRIAHGLVHPQDCNIVTAVTVIHLYLLLSLFRLKERGRN